MTNGLREKMQPWMIGYEQQGNNDATRKGLGMVQDKHEGGAKEANNYSSNSDGQFRFFTDTETKAVWISFYLWTAASCTTGSPKPSK